MFITITRLNILSPFLDQKIASNQQLAANRLVQFKVFKFY